MSEHEWQLHEIEDVCRGKSFSKAPFIVHLTSKTSEQVTADAIQ